MGVGIDEREVHWAMAQVPVQVVLHEVVAGPGPKPHARASRMKVKKMMEQMAKGRPPRQVPMRPRAGH